MKRGVAERYLEWFADRQATGNAQGPAAILWAYFPALLVAGLGVDISIAASVRSFNWEKNQVNIEFREASQDRILVAQRGLQNSFRRVEDIASFFEASATVGRREFRKFVGPALKLDPEIKALEWVPLVLAEDLDAFIEEVRRSFPPFRITEIGAGGDLLESADRPVYYPVLYVQPYKTNKELLGLDLGVDPIIAPLLREAERTQVMQVAPSASIIDDTGEKEQIIVVVPVFDDDETPEQPGPQMPPRARGFSIGIFYVGDIIENALKSLRAAGVDIHFMEHVHVSGFGELVVADPKRLPKILYRRVGADGRSTTGSTATPSRWSPVRPTTRTGSSTPSRRCPSWLSNTASGCTWMAASAG